MHVFVRSLNGVTCSGGGEMRCSATCATDDDHDDTIEEADEDDGAWNENANELLGRQRDVVKRRMKIAVLDNMIATSINAVQY